MAVVAVLPAAGRGERFGAAKQFLPLAGQSVLWHAARPFVRSAEVSRVVVVVRAEDESRAKEILSNFNDAGGGKCEVLPNGGRTRAMTVVNGLALCAEDDWAVVHDAARPCLPADALARLLADDDANGAALALPLADALHRGEDGRMCGIANRAGHYLMQTPQKFLAGALRAALRAHPAAADEAEAMFRSGIQAKLLAGDSRNIKITHPHDLALAESVGR